MLGIPLKARHFGRYLLISSSRPGGLPANLQGIWNEQGKSIRITVLPPWWRTWWAYVLEALLVITGIFAFIHFRTNNLLNQRNLLEEKVEVRTAALRESQQRAEEAKQTERQFLANMSHEIRTPMNAIIGMTNLALKTPLNPLQSKYLNGIKTSSQNLLVIINDILDITKIDSGKIEFPIQFLLVIICPIEDWPTGHIASSRFCSVH